MSQKIDLVNAIVHRPNHTVWRSSFRSDTLRNAEGELYVKPEQCQNTNCSSMAPLEDCRAVVDGVLREGWLCRACSSFHPSGSGKF